MFNRNIGMNRLMELGICSIAVTVYENEHQSATFSSRIQSSEIAGTIQVANISGEKNCLSIGQM